MTVNRDNYLVDTEIRGKVVVSGIGEFEEDEFMLELLNRQVSCIVLVFF